MPGANQKVVPADRLEVAANGSVPGEIVTAPAGGEIGPGAGLDPGPTPHKSNRIAASAGSRTGGAVVVGAEVVGAAEVVVVVVVEEVVVAAEVVGTDDVAIVVDCAAVVVDGAGSAWPAPVHQVGRSQPTVNDARPMSIMPGARRRMDRTNGNDTTFLSARHANE